MKELSIEEKARAYDEAIKVADNIHRFSSDPAEIKRMGQIFPELVVESEDERIRKRLIDFFEDWHKHSSHCWSIAVNDILAWLEKQGEHANFFNKIQIGDKVTRNRDGVLVNLSQLNRVAKPAEKQDENSMGISEATKQKLEDNLNKALAIETGESWNEFLEKQAEQKPFDYENANIQQYDFAPKSAMEAIKEEKVDNADKVEPKFNIGDIVKHKDNPHLTYILKRFTDDGDYEFHAIGKDGNEGETCFAVVNYQDEWVLVKPRSSWSEQDESRLAHILHLLDVKDDKKYLLMFGLNSLQELEKDIAWLESLKDKTQPQSKLKWSEEDLYKIEHALFGTYAVDVATRLLNKIKSPRPQNTWKPSDEQMKVLEELVEDNNQRYFYTILKSLYEQLKKL